METLVIENDSQDNEFITPEPVTKKHRPLRLPPGCKEVVSPPKPVDHHLYYDEQHRKVRKNY